MEKVGQGNYFYCDTDSLFVNQAGLDNLSDLLHDTEIGKLKIEYETDTITIYGLKDYVTSSKTVTKGIRKNAIRVSDCVYAQDSWPSIKGVLRDNVSPLYTVKKIEKHLKRDYTKGTITVSGSILPFVFDESHPSVVVQAEPPLLPFS